MPQSAFYVFDQFAADLGAAVHNFFAAGHTLRVYLSNATPNQATHAVKADLAEITQEHGYTGPIDIENDASQTGGVLTVTAVDKVITPSGGTIGPFRYAIVYNDTPTSPADPLVGFFDYGSPITPDDGEPFTLDFGASLLTVTV